MAEVSTETPSTQTFDIGDPLPEEYRDLLTRMMAHEGERTGNKSFMKFFESVLDCAEKYAPNQDAQLIMAGYVAEEMKHCIMFHRLIMEIDKDLVFRDTPFAHYAFHLPRNTWTDMNWFNFFLDLNGAFHAGEWKHSSYLPLRRIAATIDEKSSSMSTRSAAARATSVPLPPIAIPICAALNAGASFTPSPVMATTSPRACSARTIRSFCSGATLA